MVGTQQALSIEVLLQLCPGAFVCCCISTPPGFHTRWLRSQHPSRKKLEFTPEKSATSNHMVKVLFCSPAPPHALSEWFLVMMHNCMLNEYRRWGFINALWSACTRHCGHGSVNAVMHNDVLHRQGKHLQTSHAQWILERLKLNLIWIFDSN
jgi:hypothetical protein